MVSTRSRRLPSVTHLRAFEATARHRSFTRAALELNVTQTAVSHQIKALEEFLDVRLFIREAGQIHLAPAAHDYLDTVRQILSDLSAATQRMMDSNNQGLLTIGCMTAYGMKRLIPNLRDFIERHPDIPVRVETFSAYEGAVRHNYDVAIRYGSGNWPGQISWKLQDEEVFPVCSPLLLNSPVTLNGPVDLCHHRVIRTVSLILQDEWSTWLEMAGVEDLQFHSEIIFESLLPSLEAATAGLGFVMGRSAHLEHDLEAGDLVAPFSFRLPSSSGFYLVSRPEMAELPKVEAFRNWALEFFSGQPSGTEGHS